MTLFMICEILRSRGLVVQNDESAQFYLEHLNYYRLCAYWRPFESCHQPHAFKPNTSFDDVVNLYRFDRELRLLIFEAIERVEISIRGHWSYCLAHHYGPHGYLDNKIAVNQEWLRKNKDDLMKEIERSDETFILHFVENHAEEFPPVWAACEVMSLGLLSRWYKNLSPKPTRRWIAKVYAADDEVLSSWLHHLSIIRNLCAHHSRLWNREFAVLPARPKTKPQMISQQMVNNRTLYNSIVILLYLMDIVALNHTWRAKLKELLKNNQAQLFLMGFPEDWEQRTIWKISA